MSNFKFSRPGLKQADRLRMEGYVFLQVRNERLFYKVLIDNVEELLPIVYTPIEGDACEDYSEIFHNPNGLFISIKEKYVTPKSTHKSKE